MSQIFQLRFRPLFLGSLAIALASIAFCLPPARLAGQVPAPGDAHPISDLQEERLATLRQLADLVDQKRQEGSASLAEVAAARRDVAEAELTGERIGSPGQASPGGSGEREVILQ